MRGFPGLVLITLGLLTASCHKAEEKAAPWVIKTYKTDVSQGDASAKTLNKLLNPDPVKSWLYKGDHSEEEVSRVEPSRGVARVAGAGLIAVNTSEELHAGVPDLLAQIAQAKARPLTELQTEGWLLVAVPASTKAPLPAALRDKLGAYEEAYPGRCIVEVDHFLVRSVEGTEFHAKGDLTALKGYVMTAGDKILAELEFSGKLVEFESQVTFRPGEAVVISQAARHAKKLPRGLLDQCGIKSDEPLDLHTLVAIKSAPADSK